MSEQGTWNRRSTVISLVGIGEFQSPVGEMSREFYTVNVRFRRSTEEYTTNDEAPSHRIYDGRAEIGAAWTKTSKEGRDYLSIKLDDPSFNAPIFASLFADEDAKTFNLIWSRARTSNGN